MKKFFVTCILVSILAGLSAQTTKDRVMFEIGNQKITQSQFLKEFLQSQGISPSAPKTACTYEKRKAIEEYADLYYNYHLKLADAYQLGMDTTRSLKKELNTYRAELAAPYLMDSITMEQLLREAYERNKYILHASHILVRCKAHGSASDTMSAYLRIMELRRRIVEGGEDFNAVALEYNNSQLDKGGYDPNQKRDDNGDLGTFGVFDMVYSFESAAYSLNPGEVSMPVRTPYGYHIIKLHSKTPFFSRVTLQHIWVSTEKNAEYAKTKIFQAYSQLEEGKSFSMVANNYSDDKSSASNGGLLSDMMSNQIPPEYVAELGKLAPGSYSKPFQTEYGWHIVFLNNQMTLPPFEELVPLYKQRMVRDVRTKKTQDSFVEQCKQKYGFTDYTEMYQKTKKGKVYLASLDNAIAAVTDSVFRKKWHYRESMVTDNRVLFSFADKEYRTGDLLKFIEANQTLYREPYGHELYVREKYKAFVAQELMKYADSQLETESEEFAELVNQYREGLMIFNYNEKMIWSKALRDTAGLEAFYAMESKKKDIDKEEDAQYFWNTRASVVNLRVKDSSAIDPMKAQKLIAKAVAKKRPVEEYTDILKENMSKKVDSAFCTVASETLLVESGNQSLLKNNEWKEGVYVHPSAQGYTLLVVQKVIDPMLKALDESKGYYMNDYQNYVEQQLIESLKTKFNAKFHRDVLDETTY